MTEMIFGNPLQSWLMASASATVAFCMLLLIRRFLVRRIVSHARKTENIIDDILAEVPRNTKTLTLLAVSVAAGLPFLTLDGATSSLLKTGLVVLLIVQAAIWAGAIVSFSQQRLVLAESGENPAAITTRRAITFALRFIVWSVAVLLVLDNLGVNITGLIAGLGIGGIAVALAAQNILGDLFASLSIVLDKPFVVGDFIILESYMGTVEDIGLKSTRIRSLSGEQIIVPNSNLLSCRIRNYKRMTERRVILELDVTYQTPPEKLELLKRIMHEAIASQAMTRFDRAHFKQFGPSSLRFEAVYYILDPDYNRFMDVQEAVGMTILRACAREHIDFAYPTQTVFVQETAGGGSKDVPK